MVRLVIICLFLLLSLLCIFPAPVIQLWYVSILVLEFPWVFWIVMILLLLSGYRVQRYAMSGSVLGIIALLLFLSPVMRAYNVGAGLDKDIEAAFGEGTSKLKYNSALKPFSIGRMLSGINTPQLPYTTLAYSANTDGPLTLDYYRSVISGKRPCLVVVHGGSWTGGDSRQLPELNSYLANVGYNVATINYGLVPKYRFPVPEDDVHATFTYLRAHAEELGIDTNNFVLLGRSAGGQIVLTAAYTLHEPGLKGVIDIYGPADMVWGYAHPANPLVLNSCKLMEDFLCGTYAQVPQNYVASSGTEMATPLSVPTLMIHGRNDPLVSYEHSIRLGNKLREKGVPHFFLDLPWATHGCDYTLNGPSGQLSTYTIERFMAYVTGR
ncbi:MAG: alpha/beta hydrolase [Flavipsychrobacter sp.]|nr:alpha/beta hydrolase [Flavipsychrobacter sp.]